MEFTDYKGDISGEFINSILKIKGPEAAHKILSEHFYELTLKRITFILSRATVCLNAEVHAQDLNQCLWMKVNDYTLKVYFNDVVNPFINPKGWLNEIAKNIAIDHINEHIKSKDFELDSIEHSQVILPQITSQGLPFPSDFQNQHKQLEDKEVLKNLYKSLRELSETDRLIIDMRLDGIEHAEIAKLLGISVLNVRARYSRAVHKLRRKHLDAGGLL